MSQQTKQQTKNAALDVVDTVKRGDAPSNDQVTKVIDKTQQFLEEKKFDPNVAGTQVRLFF
jgi:methyl coenzyme M reductase subunit C